MYLKVLSLLRCPQCQGGMSASALALTSSAEDDEEDVSEGVLHCDAGHWFPVVRGIPRFLPDSLLEHWPVLEAAADSGEISDEVRSVLKAARSNRAAEAGYERRTQENFSLQWGKHALGDQTWGIELDERVQRYFLDAVRIPPEDLSGRVLLDAGCGNGTQSVAYADFGLEVIGLDFSSGLEHGQRFRMAHSPARRDSVHFVQADLQAPPLGEGSVDVIHSAGVLHTTPDTEQTFRRLCKLLRPGGTFYIWVFKYERFVTPTINAIRQLTTRVSSPVFARSVRFLIGPFQFACSVLDRLGVRPNNYARRNRREAAVAIMDIFGPPYAHYHSFDEVAGWYKTEGFGEVWMCSDDQRGFGICGRLPPAGRPTERSDQELSTRA